jgi:hypothetical protein
MRRLTIAVLCSLVAMAFVPRWWCGRDAGDYFRGELEAQDRLARSVAAAILEHPGREFYATGNARFDGQSAIAIYQMAISGLGQIVLDHPERRDAYLPAMRAAADRLVDPATLVYAARVYGRNGIAGMRPGEGHAYLGYVNLALGMLRAVDPETRHAALHDRLTGELARRLEQSPTGLIETYPGETWPPDVAAVAGSIGMHARATGTDRSAFLAAWAKRFEECSLHRSGYLVQRVKSGSCVPLDAPRGSGTAVASYFIGFADVTLSRRLHDALVAEGRRSLLGFSAIREYAAGHGGTGDVNAGPILLGVSVGATGFGIGAARTHSNASLYRELVGTLFLFGLPVDRGDERWFASGGVLGNALVLAMLTARPV